MTQISVDDTNRTSVGQFPKVVWDLNDKICCPLSRVGVCAGYSVAVNWNTEKVSKQYDYTWYIDVLNGEI